MKVYKISLWKFIKPSVHIIFLLIFFVFLMGVLMLGLFYKDGHIPTFLVVLTIIWVLLYSVPNLVLHINYYKEDSKKKLSIDLNKEIVTISRDEKEYIFFFKDIVKVVRIGMRPSKFNGFDSIAAWRYFYYYKIALRDANSVYLTRFLVQDLEKILNSLPIEHLQQRYPIVKDI